MDNLYLTAVLKELIPEVAGRSVSRLSLSASTLLIDLRLSEARRLLISLDPSSPALYLSTDFEIQPRAPRPFLSLLRKHLSEARLVNISKSPIDRFVQIDFERLDSNHDKIRTSLMLALTGRSANAYLADADGTLIGAPLFETEVEQLDQLRPTVDTFDPGSLTSSLDDSMTQSEAIDRFFGTGSIFGPQLKNEFLARCHDATPATAFRSLVDDLFNRDPVPLLYSRLPLDEIGERVMNIKTDLLLSHIELAGARDMLRHQFSSLSEAADRYYNLRSQAIALRAEWTALKQTLSREINRREAAIRAIESDRARFEDPEKLKRYGDLLLANLANAQIDGNKVTVVDYYDADQSKIQINLPEGASLEEAASDYYRRYQKARRALVAIASREREVSRNLDPLKELLLKLERDPASDCIDEVRRATEKTLRGTEGVRRATDKRARRKATITYGRRFRSSDGYEIAVGRNDRDNEVLTFRVARATDIWLHAADYPGSHVVIRNPKREPVPHRTITEAAELAAFYSQAKHEGKAAVHYTQKKFVSKPPRSRPGLVRLSSFKTIVVAPRCNLPRLT